MRLGARGRMPGRTARGSGRRSLTMRFGLGKGQKREVEVTATFGVVRSLEGDLITEQLRAFGAHTRPELAFLSSVVDPGDRVFDLGAHIGSFAVPLGQRVGDSGMVVAVEADEDVFRLLQRNIAANGLADTVPAVNALVALGGPSYVALRDRDNTGATRFARRRFWQQATRVPVRSLDELVAEYGSPAVVKIDIEGLELDVLEASMFVENQQPILYTELSASQLARYSRSVAEFALFFEKLEYRLFRNVGDRNAAHDRFEVVEIDRLSDVEAPLFDVLAMPREHPRTTRLSDR